MKPISGHLYRQGASQQQLAVMQHHANVVTLTNSDGATLIRCDSVDLAFEPRLGQAPRQILFPNGDRFVTEDHAAVARLEHPSFAARLHRLEKFGPHLIAFTIACIGFAVLLWRYGLDLLVAAAIYVTPPQVLDQIDHGTLAVIDQTFASPSQLPDPKRAQMQQVFEQVMAVMPADILNKHQFNLQFRSVDGIGPNAFALPGGTIVFTDALINEFPDQNVLSGVLAHELIHVTQYHGLHRMYRSLGSYVLVALLAGDVGPILDDLLLEGQAIFALSYSRAQETEADLMGLRIAKDAGFDPAGLVKFFDSLPKSDGLPNWLSSHPAHGDRSDAIRQMVDELSDGSSAK